MGAIAVGDQTTHQLNPLNIVIVCLCSIKLIKKFLFALLGLFFFIKGASKEIIPRLNNTAMMLVPMNIEKYLLFECCLVKYSPHFFTELDVEAASLRSDKKRRNAIRKVACDIPERKTSRGNFNM